MKNIIMPMVGLALIPIRQVITRALVTSSTTKHSHGHLESQSHEHKEYDEEHHHSHGGACSHSHSHSHTPSHHDNISHVKHHETSHHDHKHSHGHPESQSHEHKEHGEEHHHSHGGACSHSHHKHGHGHPESQSQIHEHKEHDEEHHHFHDGACSHSHSHSHSHTPSHNHNHEDLHHDHADSGKHHSCSQSHSHSHHLDGKSMSQHEKKHNHQHIDHNMEGIFLHVLADTLGSVGVVISTLLIKYKGWLVADPACSIFISVLIVASVIPLLRNSAEVLLQRVPRAHEQELNAAVNDVIKMNGVCGVQNMHVWNLTNSDVVGTLHLRISSDIDKAAIKDRVSSIFREAGVKDLTLQIECVKDL